MQSIKKNLILMFRLLLLSIIIVGVLSCQNLEPRRPINKQKQVFLRESAKRNKNIITIEQTLFRQATLQEEELSFESTPQGFWYAYQKKTPSDTSYPKKGDRVTIYLPMIPELPISMLACARIGAVHTVVFSGFSANSLSDRVEDSQSKIESSHSLMVP